MSKYLPDMRDLTLALGLSLLSVGGWYVYPPLVALIPGFVLTGIAIFGTR